MEPFPKDRTKVITQAALQSSVYVLYLVLVFPQVIKGGFFIGGAGGTGVLVARDAKTGDWSQPAFYTIGSVTFGKRQRWSS